jgi:DNA-directed RNA polymerase subunit RPC12/RpoP
MTKSIKLETIDKPQCPYCKSFDVLPFEDDDGDRVKHTFTLILISAFLLFTVYILFLLSAYLFFPGVVILSIYFFTRVVNELEKKKKIIYMKKHFLCIKCGRSFEDIEKISKIV